jgi:hypothetical protein
LLGEFGVKLCNFEVLILLSGHVVTFSLGFVGFYWPLLVTNVN